MILDKLQIASFRNIEFLTPSGTVSEGRKTVTHEYVNSDIRYVEDLGASIPKYKLKAIVHGVDAITRRDAFRRVLKQPGIGVLVHPVYGRVQVTVESQYEISHSDNYSGSFEFDITFAESKEVGVYPTRQPTKLTSVLQSNQLTRQSAFSALAQNWLVPLSSVSRLDAVSKLTDFVNLMTFSLGSVSGDLSGISSVLSTLYNPVSFVGDGVQMASFFSSAYDEIESADVDQFGLYQSLYQIFGYGSDDPPIRNRYGLSYDQRRRDYNRQLLNGVISSANLSSAYVAASGVEYMRTDELDDTRTNLEIEADRVFTVVADTGINFDASTRFGIQSNPAPIADALFNLKTTRTQANQLLDEARTRAYFIDQFYAQSKTSARLLSYQFYADTELSPQIESLNRISRPSNLDRETLVLTR